MPVGALKPFGFKASAGINSSQFSNVTLTDSDRLEVTELCDC